LTARVGVGNPARASQFASRPPYSFALYPYSFPFDRELTASLQRIREAIAPYTGFVRREREKLDDLEGQLLSITTAIQSVRLRLKDFGNP
jgi:hypothetical protein